MKRNLRSASAVTVVLFACTTLHATGIGGLICEDTTLTQAGSPYVVGDSIVVGCGATLTIEPGVVLRFDTCRDLAVGLTTFGPGTLIARGTEDEPIIFTSSALTPIPGDWTGFRFGDAAIDATFDGSGNYLSGCILEHAIVEFAGCAVSSAVTLDDCSPYLASSLIHLTEGRGIEVQLSVSLAVRIEFCEIAFNTIGLSGAGIFINGGLNHILTGNLIHDCVISGGSNKVGAGMFINAPVMLMDNIVTANANNSSGNGSHGGGIFFGSLSDGSTLTGNTICENSTGRRGGGIYFNSSGIATLTDNTICDNSALDGGGIYFTSSPRSSLTANTIINNDTLGSGGGIYFASSGNATLTDNTISGNACPSSAGFGGGIYFTSSGGNILMGNTISGNATGFDGGGIYATSSGALDLDNNVIGGNTAGRHGGGIYATNSPDIDLNGDAISGNAAGLEGGGICAVNSDNLDLDNICIVNNTAASRGGGLFIINCDNVATNPLSSVVIASNSAQDDGGAIYLENSDDWTISDSEICQNESAKGMTGGLHVVNSLRLSLAGDEENQVFNTICQNSGFQVSNTNAFDLKPDANVDATFLNWCTDDIGEIQLLIFDHFDNAAVAFVLFFPPAPGSIPCPWDLDDDGFVGITDFLELLANWGLCQGVCPSDFNCDGSVGIVDFLALLANWGPCPTG